MSLKRRNNQRLNRRRIRFEILEDRKVMDASGLVSVDAPTAMAGEVDANSPAQIDLMQSSSQAAVATVSGGTLTLDAVILGGVQNDLIVSLGNESLVSTELSGTIDISTATGDGVEITGFTVSGGLINTTNASGLIDLVGVSAEPLDINPGLNPVVGGNFDASEVGLTINNGIAQIPLISLTYDFATDPVQGPGSGIGTVVVNSVNGNDYDITVTIPISLELEAAPGIFASVDGTIVASGTVSISPEPAEIISGFYNQIKDSVGSDVVFGDLIVAAKTAIDSGDTSLRDQVWLDAHTLTAELSNDVVAVYNEIESGLSDPDEIDYLRYSVLVVISELEALRDFLTNAVFSPNQYQSLTPMEFFGAAVQEVQERVYGLGESN